LTPKGFRSLMEQHVVSLQKREAEFAELQRDKAELGVKIAGLTKENAALTRRTIELTAAAAADAEKIRDLQSRLHDAEVKADRLITVKQEKMDITQDLYAAADQVEHARGEKRKAEQQLEEEKESHEQPLQAHHQVQEQQAAELRAAREQSECGICLERPVTHIYPCGHRICGECDEALPKRVCPTCEKPIRQVTKIY
jgi:DNA repair exonuclease SbcCD ATPase subunit